MSRPSRVVFVSGTGTEIGKTWVTAGVVRELRSRGLSVCARKPAQSFDADEGGFGSAGEGGSGSAGAGAAGGVGSGAAGVGSGAGGVGSGAAGVGGGSTDAGVLAGAGGEPVEVVCPPHRWYPVAMAPPMAAAVLGRPSFGVADLAREVESSWPDPPASIGLIEGAGGLAAPHASDGDGLALASALGAQGVVIVAPAGLGTINSVRLCMRALGAAGGPPAVVFLNRFDALDDLHVANRDWLAGRDGYSVCTDLPALADRLISGAVQVRHRRVHLAD